MAENIEDLTEDLNSWILEHPSNPEGNPAYWERFRETAMIEKDNLHPYKLDSVKKEY